MLATSTVGGFRCVSGIAIIFDLVGEVRQCFSGRTDAGKRREVDPRRPWTLGRHAERAMSSVSCQFFSWGSAKRVTAGRQPPGSALDVAVAEAYPCALKAKHRPP